jgi:radical SAM protein with 4Fe4S-binding SPASM domain
MASFEFNNRARRLRRYLGIKLGRPLAGPQVVSLETTHHCNLRCSFCESHGILLESPITAKREYVGGKKKMDLETIRRVARELAEVGTDLVELSGKGDPIAHPQLTEIVKAIKDAGLQCALVTNGTLAKPDLAPTLVERGLDRLSVSLNSGSREVFLRSNKRDLWDKATGFLAEVLARRRAAGARRPWVRISHVVTKENVDDLENMVGICVQLGVDEVSFYVMGELPETPHLQLDDREVAGVRAEVDRWCGILDRGHVVHALPMFARELELRAKHGKPQENPLQRRIPCYEGWMFCVIGPDGVVAPCCYCEEENLGNVHDASFSDIWYGALYKKYREDSLAMPKTGRQICDECFTSCNRAKENLRVHNRVHPLGKISHAEPEVPVCASER